MDEPLQLLQQLQLIYGYDNTLCKNANQKYTRHAKKINPKFTTIHQLFTVTIFNVYIKHRLLLMVPNDSWRDLKLV